MIESSFRWKFAAIFMIKGQKTQQEKLLTVQIAVDPGLEWSFDQEANQQTIDFVRPNSVLQRKLIKFI